ncbi:uncharacterized protein CLUP02_04185 [Colletotrichum lupini]|uniref:Uncharacterized protein n=1 Tax=Colletotrichum lupini TaxID=145971 RepID=A0A9Q8SKA8_9PEZI|nr:uncharacterized protein CLUP02_04185 [Colletotrichum lupini]UQC78708.1 hypothetical protein CLUP02_04185 [Colletotrichum lupini]
MWTPKKNTASPGTGLSFRARRGLSIFSYPLDLSMVLNLSKAVIRSGNDFLNLRRRCGNLRHFSRLASGTAPSKFKLRAENGASRVGPGDLRRMEFHTVRRYPPIILLVRNSATINRQTPDCPHPSTHAWYVRERTDSQVWILLLASQPTPSTLSLSSHRPSIDNHDENGMAVVLVGSRPLASALSSLSTAGGTHYRLTNHHPTHPPRPCLISSKSDLRLPYLVRMTRSHLLKFLSGPQTSTTVHRQITDSPFRTVTVIIRDPSTQSRAAFRMSVFSLSSEKPPVLQMQQQLSCLVGVLVRQPSIFLGPFSTSLIPFLCRESHAPTRQSPAHTFTLTHSLPSLHSLCPGLTLPCGQSSDSSLQAPQKAPQTNSSVPSSSMTFRYTRYPQVVTCTLFAYTAFSCLLSSTFNVQGDIPPKATRREHQTEWGLGAGDRTVRAVSDGNPWRRETKNTAAAPVVVVAHHLNWSLHLSQTFETEQISIDAFNSALLVYICPFPVFSHWAMAVQALLAASSDRRLTNLEKRRRDSFTSTRVATPPVSPPPIIRKQASIRQPLSRTIPLPDSPGASLVAKSRVTGGAAINRPGKLLFTSKCSCTLPVSRWHAGSQCERYPVVMRSIFCSMMQAQTQAQAQAQLLSLGVLACSMTAANTLRLLILRAATPWHRKVHSKEVARRRGSEGESVQCGNLQMRPLEWMPQTCAGIARMGHFGRQHRDIWRSNGLRVDLFGPRATRLHTTGPRLPLPKQQRREEHFVFIQQISIFQRTSRDAVLVFWAERTRGLWRFSLSPSSVLESFPNAEPAVMLINPPCFSRPPLGAPHAFIYARRALRWALSVWGETRRSGDYMAFTAPPLISCLAGNGLVCLLPLSPPSSEVGGTTFGGLGVDDSTIDALVSGFPGVSVVMFSSTQAACALQARKGPLEIRRRSRQAENPRVGSLICFHPLSDSCRKVGRVIRKKYPAFWDERGGRRNGVIATPHNCPISKQCIHMNKVARGQEETRKTRDRQVLESRGQSVTKPPPPAVVDRSIGGFNDSATSAKLMHSCRQAHCLTASPAGARQQASKAKKARRVSRSVSFYSRNYRHSVSLLYSRLLVQYSINVPRFWVCVLPFLGVVELLLLSSLKLALAPWAVRVRRGRGVASATRRFATITQLSVRGKPKSLAKVEANHLQKELRYWTSSEQEERRLPPPSASSPPSATKPNAPKEKAPTYWRREEVERSAGLAVAVLPLLVDASPHHTPPSCSFTAGMTGLNWWWRRGCSRETALGNSRPTTPGLDPPLW